MKTNEALQADVQNAIKWEPLLNAAEIGVTVKDGVVTLTGTVDSYAKKIEAESAAKSITGVKAVVEKIEISFNHQLGEKDDNEIATDILSGLKWNWAVPNDKIKVTVEKGWVTLEGQTEWHYQKEAAKKSVSNQAGVKGVTNNITIKSDVTDAVEQRDIEHALTRNWAIDDDAIKVKVSGDHVTLNGTVNSFYQREEAERIAWNAPGVSKVDNDLVIEYD